MIAAIAFTVLASAASDDFKLGAAAYEAQRFEEARTHFEAALADTAVSRGPTLYNLGHCAFRTGRHAQAVVYYTAALQHLPGDERIHSDRNLARRELGLPSLPLEPPGPFTRFDAQSGFVRLGLIGSLQFVALWGWLLSRNRLARMLLAAILAIALIGAFHLVQTELAAPTHPAVVVAEEVSLRSEPHTNLAILFELKAGELVTVHEHSPRWARVSHERGSGWVERAGLGWVEPAVGLDETE